MSGCEEEAVIASDSTPGELLASSVPRQTHLSLPFWLAVESWMAVWDVALFLAETSSVWELEAHEDLQEDWNCSP